MLSGLGRQDDKLVVKVRGDAEIHGIHIFPFQQAPEIVHHGGNFMLGRKLFGLCLGKGDHCGDFNL